MKCHSKSASFVAAAEQLSLFLNTDNDNICKVWCVGIFLPLYCKFTKKSFDEKIENRLRFDGVMATSLWPHFFGPPCILHRRAAEALGPGGPFTV